MGFWGGFTKHNAQEIIAIDIGTASVSAVLARKGPRATEIITVLRHPFDLLHSENNQKDQKHALHSIQNALTTIFTDAQRLMPHPNAIRISFSEIFFKEHTTEKIIERAHPQKPIEQSEIDALFVDSGKLAGALVSINREILGIRVNGYPVASPTGYQGNTIQARVRELTVSRTLYDYIEMLRDRWFPQNTIVYSSDPQVLLRALRVTVSEKTPTLMIDMGGEVTGCYLIQDSTILRQCEPIFIGLKTLERRVAALLKLDELHAVSVMRQYSAGTLDHALALRVNSIGEEFLKNWLNELGHVLNVNELHGAINQIYLIGSGRDVPQVSEYLNRHIEAITHDGTNISVRGFIIALDSLLPPKSLSRGGDAILASLILYDK